MSNPIDPAYGEREALLVLEDGTLARGRAYGARGIALGEIVFATGMTGYQETLTDPSYHRQIVMMTAPHVGNTGMNSEDPESQRIWVSGFVVRDPAPRASSWRADAELEDELREQGVVAIAEIDTRAMTRHLRELGVMRAGIFSGPDLPTVPGAQGVAALVERVRAIRPMAGQSLSEEVSTSRAYTVEPPEGTPVRGTVVAVDLGIKAMTAQRLTERGLRVHVVPASTTLDEILEHRPDGVFFSNGPGDPAAADAQVDLLRGVLEAGIGFFGICFGNQLLGRALGYDTFKLDYGHRGLNQPVRDVLTGKVEITTHNHGFAVDVPVGEPSDSPYDGGRYGRVRVSHVSLTDGVVEGLQCLDIPAFSVQYHPEAAAGPHEAAYLFDRFVAMIAPETAAMSAGEDT
ncbi:glutamine-hydrolyzing carbamoyl-phosphate synthase small subunit [Pseudactinotalea sp. Z1739]|uniref:glutamine-hydrolyzing carbamoyl-phosphate synthase small subunit n=1 Tax=Pseudactinotalea sp. Z1739 TaxID=3413028 RepID=UPI003C7EC0BD